MTIKLYEKYYRENGDHYDVDAFANDENLDNLDSEKWSTDYADRITEALTFMSDYNRIAGHAYDGKARYWINAVWNGWFGDLR